MRQSLPAFQKEGPAPRKQLRHILFLEAFYLANQRQARAAHSQTAHGGDPDDVFVAYRKRSLGHESSPGKSRPKDFPVTRERPLWGLTAPSLRHPPAPKIAPRYGAFLFVPVFREPNFSNVLTPNFRTVLGEKTITAHLYGVPAV